MKNIGAGNFIGEMALINGEPRSATVSAATEVSLLSLYAVDFQNCRAVVRRSRKPIRKTALEGRGGPPKEIQAWWLRHGLRIDRLIAQDNCAGGERRPAHDAPYEINLQPRMLDFVEVKQGAKE
ncbi:cyclic nucleotide-binding domain-containing protein [Rhizobium leguminosarum bv. viciae]|nr:cyclic nucleotide-binding domain-containing protein [Rhizobium leguminosarum bv. viciae]